MHHQHPHARPLTPSLVSPLDPAPEPDRTVLYIEDDHHNVRLIEHILRRMGSIALISANTGHLGIELAIRERPDLVLLDGHLPDMSGEEVAAALQASPATRVIPILVLTGTTDEALRRRMLLRGVSGYLTKPFSIDELSALIDRLAG